MKEQEHYRLAIKQKKRIVIKIGTSTLTHKNGKLNLRLIDKLVMVISDLWNQDKEVLLVTSGAIGVGASRLGLTEKPVKLAEKQALAAIGQAQLMKMYKKFFNSYNIVAAQILLTKDGLTVPDRRLNAKNTVDTYYSNKDCDPYHDYKELLARDDIDAISIAVPDHWHAIIGCAVAFSNEDNKLLTIGYYPAEQTIKNLDILTQPYSKIVAYDDLEKAKKRLKQHQLHSLIQTDKRIIWINPESTQSKLIKQLIQNNHSDYQIKELSGELLRYVDWVIPGVLGMNIMFGSLFSL